MRNRVQELVPQLWDSNNRKGSFLLCTGLGKSKIMVDTIKRIWDEGNIQQYDYPILYLANSNDLVENGFPAEMRKWGLDESIISKVTLKCYQGVIDMCDKKIGLLLADEFDFAITEKYFNVLVCNNTKYSMLMSGTITEDQRLRLVQHYPILLEVTIDDGVNHRIVNDFDIFIHKVPLLPKRSKEYPYGEASAYNWLQTKIVETKREIDLLTARLAITSRPDVRKAITDKLDKAYKSKTRLESGRASALSRANLMYKNQTNVLYATALKNYLLDSNTDNKIIIFSKFSEELDKITEYGYHNKKNDKSIIKRFNNGEIREMGAMKKVARGVNFQGLNCAIYHSYDSSVTNFQQSLVGRLVRLDINQRAQLHIITNTYVSDKGEITDCQNNVWVSNFMSSINKQPYILNSLQVDKIRNYVKK